MKRAALAAHGMMKASLENRPHRAISILLVLILHALLIFALLRFMVRPQNFAFRRVPETHLFETIINTARPPEPRTRKDARRPASTPGAAQHVLRTPAPSEPTPTVPTPTAPTPTLDIRGFGQALSGCAPENLTNIDEAQRARCRRIGALPSYDPTAVDYADHSDKVPGAKQWERELARKKAPLLLPCGNSKAFDPVYTAGCIIANIANGFTFKKQYENQPAYSDWSGK